MKHLMFICFLFSCAVMGTSAETMVEKLLAERISELDRQTREGTIPSTPVAKDDNRWWLGAVEVKQRQVRAVQGQTIDLVMIGDSITYNWEEKGFGLDVWPVLTNRFSTVNLGIAADRVQHALWRCQNGQLDGYKARYVQVLIGTNNDTDRDDSIAAGYAKLLDTIAEKQPQAKVIMVAIFPRARELNDGHRQRTVRINRLLKALCEKRGHYWLDFNTRLLNADGSLSPEMMPDFLHPKAESYRIWLDELTKAIHLLDVNLLVGTEGEGNMTPSAAFPNGMLNPGPDTIGEKDTACSGYRYSDTALVGFSQWHLNGTGHPGLGDVLLFPFCGETSNLNDPAQRVFDHTKETARPGYYALTTGDIRSEMTTGRRANVFRFSRMRGNRQFKLLVDLEYCLRRRPDAARGTAVLTNETVLATNQRGLTGWTEKKSWGERAFAYSLEFSQPWTQVECVAEKNAKAPKYVFMFDIPEDGALLAKVGFSYSRDPAVATRNLLTDIPAWDFDGVQAHAETAWKDVLSRIEIEARPQIRKMFYTSLYHVFAQPNLCSDVGEPDHYTLFSLWDTFRCLHPLYTILAPELVPDFIDSFLDIYKRQGYLPVWALANREINCMIANHSVSVIVDAYFKGLVRNPAAAYAAIKDTLIGDHPANSKVNWRVYDAFGYYPNDVFKREACSRTLECAYDDACAARMAKALGKVEDAAFFAKRAGYWRNLFDPSVGFIRSRDSKGAWRKDFDPYACGWGDGYDFTEGNSWQYSWHVMQDPQGLITAMGGKDAFAAKLAKFFDPKHNELGHGNIQWYSEKELIGQYWHGNEPCQHVPWFWHFVGQDEKTDAIVREVFERFYCEAPDGLTGNDDCGQMSAWYIFAALGFYPFDPCAGEYLVHEPQVRKATIHLSNGKSFVIDGKLNGRVLRHSEIFSSAK